MKTLIEYKQDLFINLISLSQSESYIHNTKNTYNLIYFFHGTCNARVNNVSYTPSRFNYLLLRPYEKIILSNSQNESVFAYIISFTKKIVDRVCDDYVLLDSFQEENLIHNRLYTSQSLSSMHIRPLILQLKVELETENVGKTLYIHSVLCLLLTLIHRVYLEKSLCHKKVRVKGLRIDDIINYVNYHISEEISLDKLSEDLFFSKYYILHQFKKKTGISLYSYIIKRKLERSKILIEQGFPINEIYKDCGFGDYSNFFRNFKKEYGCTPKQYYNKLSKEPLSNPCHKV